MSEGFLPAETAFFNDYVSTPVVNGAEYAFSSTVGGVKYVFDKTFEASPYIGYTAAGLGALTALKGLYDRNTGNQEIRQRANNCIVYGTAAAATGAALAATHVFGFFGGEVGG